MEVQHREDSPPLWLQLPASATMLRQRPPASSIFNNSITLIILIPLLLLLVISSILSFVSHTCQFFRNNIVKNGWDLLNIVLVLFAILCGVIGKLYDDETQVIRSEVAIHTSTVSDQIMTNKETCGFAIFNELNLTMNSPPTSQIFHSGLNQVESDDCKVIPVDTCVLGPPQSLTKVPLEPSNPAKLRPRRSPKSVLHAEKQHDVNIQSPTLLRPSSQVNTAHQINNTNIAKKSGAGKDVATAIASLYKHTKMKTKHMTRNKKQKKSLSPPCTPAMAASSRPPPPPPWNALFSNILKSGVKSKLFDSKKVQSNYFNDGKKTVDVGSNRSPEFQGPPRMKMAEVAFEQAEPENVDLWSTMGSRDQLGGSVLCPSPDVNIKADEFIARLRGEWKLDHVNS